MTILINENAEQTINIVQNGRFLEFHKRNSPIMYKFDLATKSLDRIRKSTGEEIMCSMSQTTRWFNAKICTEDRKIEQMFIYSQATRNLEEPAEIIRNFKRDYMNIFEKWASLGIHFKRLTSRNMSIRPIEIEPGNMPPELRKYTINKFWTYSDFNKFCEIINYTNNGRYREHIKKIFKHITDNPDYEDAFIGCYENKLYKDGTLHILGELIDKYNLNVERLLIYINYLHQVEYIDFDIFLEQYGEYLDKEYWKCSGRKNKMYKFPKYFDSIYAIMCRKEQRIRLLEDYDPNDYEYGYLEYDDNEYIMRIPKCSADVQEEGDEQGHCIATHFMDYIARGDTAVVFMRRAEEPDIPFITIEIRNNKIRQACIGNNDPVPGRYRPWIRNWAEIKDVEIDEDESWETRLAF